MAKRRKASLGSKGPAAYWLDLKPAQRARLKADVMAGFQGERRPDGVLVPSVRSVFKGLGAADGFDLRHIERWPKARLLKARERIAQLRTLTSKPFVVKPAQNKQQRRALQRFTGQNLPYQKTFIVHVQDAKKDNLRIIDGKPTLVRVYPTGEKSFQRLYLFKDYNNGRQPATFEQMRKLLPRMAPDMSIRIQGGQAFYSLYTIPFGAIGDVVTHAKLASLLERYHAAYDANNRRVGFGEVVTGFYMTGNNIQARADVLRRERRAQIYRMQKKLKFARRSRQK